MVGVGLEYGKMEGGSSGVGKRRDGGEGIFHEGQRGSKELNEG